MGNPKVFPFVIKTTKAAILNRRPSPDKMVSMMSKNERSKWSEEIKLPLNPI